MENNLYERALRERDRHTEFYLRGMERELPVGRAYADMLSEIKQRYYQIHMGDQVPVEEVDTSKNKKRLIIAAIVFLGWLVCYQIIPARYADVPKVIYSIAASIALGFAGGNAAWGAVPFVMIIFAMIFNLDVLVTAIAAGMIIYKQYKEWDGKKQFISGYTDVSVRMKQLREEMQKLIPAMRGELQSWQQEWYNRYSHVIPRSELLDYQSDEAFPPAFWWQIPPSSIREVLRRYDCSRYGGWESRLIGRDAGKEFRATDEYSPLYGILDVSHEELMNYYRNECGCMVFDVISRDVSLEVETQRVSYEVPAHGELARLSENMSVMSLANKIDKAYNNGELSDLDYKRLAYEMGAVASSMAERHSQTRTEYATEYIPIRSHTNFWVGQFLLRTMSDNDDEFVLTQYFCQLPHMFENLEALDEVNLVYVDYDPFECNPFFLAEFYSRHPNAY